MKNKPPTSLPDKPSNILKPKAIADTDELKSKLMTLGFYSITGFLGYRFVLKPAIENMRKSQEQRQLISDPNRQQATVLYNAMNPSGISWLRNLDQTNEDMIFQAARRITDWNAVQLTYRNLYNRDLLSDLQSDLDTEEYQTFLSILSHGHSTTANGKPTGNFTSKGMMIASSKDVRLRSTPDSSPGPLSFNSNILTVIKANKFLGWATGKQKIDNKGVKYLEVMIHFKDNIPSGAFQQMYHKLKSKTMTFWVGAGAIHQFKYYKSMFERGIKLYKGVYDSGLRKHL